MPGPTQPHIFISYVHEDTERVEDLCKVFEAVNIPYWRDGSQLAPGDDWKQKIREAIQNGSLIFLACFSEASVAKAKSYMNEEISVAIDEFRKMPPGRTWFIPARLDDVAVPDWSLGAGRTLNDLHRLDLFGASHAQSAAVLVQKVNEMLGDQSSEPDQVEAALDESSPARRGETLERRTKEWLMDASKHIQLEDLVLSEAKRLGTYLTSSQLLGAVSKDLDNDAYAVEVMRRMQSIWTETEPLVRSLVIAARWATPDNIGPWVSAVRSVAATAHQEQNGESLLLPMRKIAVTALVTAVALSVVEAGRWGNLKALIVDPQIQDRFNTARSVLNSTSFAEPYRYLRSDALASAVTRSYQDDDSLEELWKDSSQKRRGQLYTPLADWMYAVLKPIVSDRLSAEPQYDETFDRAEVVLGVLSWDLNREETPFGHGYSLWFGGATWRRNRSMGRLSAAQKVQAEFELEGQAWSLLREGLFGGDLERAKEAVTGYAAEFEQIAKTRW